MLLPCLPCLHAGDELQHTLLLPATACYCLSLPVTACYCLACMQVMSCNTEAACTYPNRQPVCVCVCECVCRLG